MKLLTEEQTMGIAYAIQDRNARFANVDDIAATITDRISSIEVPACGITDDQLHELVMMATCNSEDYYDLAMKYRKYLSTQKFTGDGYTPEWSKAPLWANWLAQDALGGWTWFENKPEMQPMSWVRTNFGRHYVIEHATEWKNSLRERPIKKRDIAIGQLWKYIERDDDTSEYEITLLGYLTTGDNNWIDSVTYLRLANGNIYTQPVAAFLTKFALVG